EPPPALAVVDQVAAHEVGGRTGVGFGDADAEQAFARGRQRQPALLELVGPEVLDGTRRPVVDELTEYGARDVDPSELLEHDARLHVAHAHTAVLDPSGDAEQAGGPQRVPRVLRELLGFVPVRRSRGELAFGDFPRELAEGRLVLGL